MTCLEKGINAALTRRSTMQIKSKSTGNRGLETARTFNRSQVYSASMTLYLAKRIVEASYNAAQRMRLAVEGA